MPARRIAVALALTLAAVPASASAAPHARARSRAPAYYAFTATSKGSGSYSRKHVSDGVTSTVASTFRWTTPFQHVLVPRVHAPASVGYPAFSRGASASGDWKIDSPNTDDSGCVGSGVLGRQGVPGGGGGKVTDGGLTLKRATGGFTVLAQAVDGFRTVSGGGDGSSACHPADFWHDVVLTSGAAGGDDTNPALTAVTKLTSKDLRRSSFTKTVLMPPEEAAPSDCGSDAGNGVSCTQSYSWTGTIRFVRKKL